MEERCERLGIRGKGEEGGVGCGVGESMERDLVNGAEEGDCEGVDVLTLGVVVVLGILPSGEVGGVGRNYDGGCTSGEGFWGVARWGKGHKCCGSDPNREW